MTVRAPISTITNFPNTMTQPESAAIRQKVGSIRRKAINGGRGAGETFARAGTPSSFESADVNSVLWTGTPQIVSYAVTITAGSPMPEKTKEKRRIFARILHKKSASRAVEMPGITEATMSPPQRPAHLGVSPHLAPHNRAHSDTSYFRQGSAKGQEDGDGDAKPWPSTQNLSPPQNTSPPNSRTASPMSKFNTSRSPLTSQRSSPEMKREFEMANAPEATAASHVDGPLIATVFDQQRSIALRPHHPPRSTSLRDQTEVSADFQSSPQVVVQTIGEEEEMQGEGTSNSVTVTAVEVAEMEGLPPSPPPKDAKMQQPSRLARPKHEAGLNITLPGQLDGCSIEFSTIEYRNSSTRQERRPAGLPSPRLRPPRKSTLALRRQAVPKTIRIINTRKQGNNIIGVIGIIASPVQSAKDMGSPGSSWLWVQPTSPPLPIQAEDKNGTANAQTVEITITDEKADKEDSATANTDKTETPSSRQKTRKPSAGHTPMLASKATVANSHPSLPPMPASIPLTAPSPRVAKFKSHAAPSPALVKAHRRRSGNYHGAHVVTTASGQRFLKKKSTSSRKATGIRGTGRDLKQGRALNVLSGYRANKQQANTCEVNAGPAASQGRSRSPSSPSSPLLPARLTPPQAQGEWNSVGSNKYTGTGLGAAAARGRRQPSPLRKSKSGSTDKLIKPSRSTSDLLASPAPPERRSHRGLRLEMGMLPRGITFRPSAQRSRTEAGEVAKASEPASAAVAARAAPAAPANRGHRPRAPSHTASLPLNMHVFAEAAAAVEDDAQTQREASEGRKILYDAGHKVTAEESIQRMMDKQAEQQEALRAKLLLGSSSRRPSEMSVGTI